MIRAIEEHSLNALPALRTVYYDGWILRFADGYTRRANSVNPLYSGTLDTHEKIAYCERLYHNRNQRVVFKLTNAVQPSNLDDVLSKHGYAYEAPTGVHTLSLDNLPQPQLANVIIHDEPTEDWLTAFCDLNAVATRYALTLERMLSGILPRAGYMALYEGDAMVAVGLGVVDSGYIGLYDIVTDTGLRGRGLGTDLVLNLLHWGKQHGAKHAYLQVNLENAPALRLYDKLGFKEAYRYWYRVKD